MGKKVFAVTNIKGSDVWVDVGGEVDTTKFSKEELKGLYDAGAVEVRDVEDLGPDTTVANPDEVPVHNPEGESTGEAKDGE